MPIRPVTYLTHEQYLEIERKAEFPSEYINGAVLARSGGTPNHARIALNTTIRFTEQLDGSRCEAFGANLLRLHIAKYNVSTYPDVLVTCGAIQLLDAGCDTLTDATVIIEVLSPATCDYSRSEKFRYYRSLPSFSEYLLLAQNEIRAELHVRQADNSWLFREFTEPTDEIELKSVGCRLQLESLYARVEFDAEA